MHHVIHDYGKDIGVYIANVNWKLPNKDDRRSPNAEKF